MKRITLATLAFLTSVALLPAYASLFDEDQFDRRSELESIVAQAKDDPKPEPKKPAILLPDAPTPPPTPVPPPPNPAIPTKLTADVIYVVRSDLELIVLSSPANLLNVSADTGPMKIRAKFSDKPDKTETRTFTEKYIYIVEANATGLAELIVWPTGGTAKDVVRRLIDANVAPIPPPVSIVVTPSAVTIPYGTTQQFTANVLNAADQSVVWTVTAGSVSKDGVFTAPPMAGNYQIKATAVADPSKIGVATATVVAPPIPTVGKLRVLIVVDKSTVATLPKAQRDVLNLPKDLRDYLNSHCGLGVDGATPEWRVFDKDNDVSSDTAAWQAGMAKAAGKTLPYLIVANETTSWDGPLPADKAGLLAKLKEYGGP